MMSRNMVKSNASSVQPNHAAHQASHWSFVGSFHHGIVPAVVTAVVMAHPWAQAGSYNLASTVLSNKEIHRMFSSRGLTGYLGYDSFSDVLPLTTGQRRPLSTLSPIPRIECEPAHT